MKIVKKLIQTFIISLKKIISNYNITCIFQIYLDLVEEKYYYLH